MKSATIIALLASMAAAAPSGDYSSLEKRQGGTTSNDLNGPCKKVVREASRIADDAFDC